MDTSTSFKWRHFEAEIILLWPIRPANEIYNAKLSISFVSQLTQGRDTCKNRT